MTHFFRSQNTTIFSCKNPPDPEFQHRITQCIFENNYGSNRRNQVK